MSFVDRNYVYRAANHQAYLETFGKGRDEIVGYSISEVLGEEMFQNVIKKRVDRCFAGETTHYEIELDTTARGRRWHHVTYHPSRQEKSGEIEGAIIVAYDVDELKRAQQALAELNERLELQLDELGQKSAMLESQADELRKAKEVAEAANSAKSIFLANMSHELRTPLNSILGFSQIMRRDPETTASQRENLGIILRSGEHLLTLIDDVLEISKIEAGRIALEPENVDLGALMQDVTDMMRNRAEGKNLQLTLDQTSDFPRYIHGDPAKLRQILVNLIGNAIKYTESGGITLRLNAKAKAHQVRLLCEVEDTGVGIAEEDLERIFDPFEQAVRQAVAEGAGLGLAIARRYVKLMGGDISVESEPGRGSVFRFDIPVQMVPLEEKVSPPPSVHGPVIGLERGGPYRVLIVEDRVENRLLLNKLLESVGFEVREAWDGEQAIAVFEEWKPHFIWMDRRMPILDGLEATRRIKAMPGGKETIIVALTAGAFQEQRNEVLQAGCDDFLRKPFREEEIFETMARHLGVRYRYAQEALVDKEPTRGMGLALTPADLAVLSDDFLIELRQAAMAGQAKLVLELVARIEPHHPQLAAGLESLVHQYRYVKLEELTRRVERGEDDA
jgi:PAS domain S-box-containing protein